MTASNSDLERRVIERRVLVKLYRVYEWQGEVNWDSLHGYLSYEDIWHGLYCTEARALQAKKRRETDLLKDGWRRSAERDMLYKRASGTGKDYDRFLGIERLTVQEKSIARDRDGAVYYRNERIR